MMILETHRLMGRWRCDIADNRWVVVVVVVVEVELKSSGGCQVLQFDDAYNLMWSMLTAAQCFDVVNQ
ncbi:hypothetical protein OIU76_014800 [Salix suchowensis]|nr:hypothetical protein OIU76_014800 [Salix suchowensis]